MLRSHGARKIAQNISVFSSECTRRNSSKKPARIRVAKTINEIVEREPKVARAILGNTEITRNHMTPEIQLFLLTPSCSLYHSPYEDLLATPEETRNVFKEPYWCIYWPGGQALARFVLDEGKEIVSSAREVLDVGAGCGAIAIAAKLSGARKVIANDIDEAACTAISLNAALNRTDVEISAENLLSDQPRKSTDVIFLGDMLYDEEIAGILIPWLEGARRNGSRIYLADPGRHGLTEDLKKRMKLVKRYSLPQQVQRENYGFHECHVWEFLPTGRKIL